MELYNKHLLEPTTGRTPKRSEMGTQVKYKDKYCEMLIEHMEGGLSIEAFAGVVSVARSTLYEWVNTYPEFKAAKEQGYCKSLLFWEKMGRSGAAGKIINFNAASYIFNKKNRFGWRDKTEITTGKEGISIKIDIEDQKL